MFVGNNRMFAVYQFVVNLAGRLYLKRFVLTYESLNVHVFSVPILPTPLNTAIKLPTTVVVLLKNNDLSAK